MVYRCFVLAIALMFLSGGPAGRAQKANANPLAAIKGLKCTFRISAVGSWKGGEPKAEVRPAPDISVEIDEIDTDGGSARLTSGATPAEMTVSLTVSSLHFLERSMLGSVNLTSVFADETPQGKLRAVRSRHEYLQMTVPGFVAEPTVSQYYGECEARR